MTFDGANFSFNGRGEYVLLEATLTNLRVQGRAQPRTTSDGEAGARGLWAAQGLPRRRPGAERTTFCTRPSGTQDRGTGLTAVAVQEGNSDVLEVRLAAREGVLQVLLNQEVLSFTEQSWMDLKGEWDGQGASAGRSHALSLPPEPPCLSLGSPGPQNMDVQMEASQ